MSNQLYKPAAPSIKLVTMHSSKGLEFSIIFIPGIGRMPDSNQSPQEEARLLYVGMTRSIDHLVMSCDRASEFVQRLEVAIGKVRVSV
jgi:superfamily I DNA/RNA helicase